MHNHILLIPMFSQTYTHRLSLRTLQVHFNLFAGTVFALGTPAQVAALEARNRQRPRLGCFGLTEARRSQSDAGNYTVAVAVAPQISILFESSVMDGFTLFSSNA